MAFWALYKHKWFKRKIPNMITMYRKMRYDAWFNSLPKEKQEAIKRKEEEEYERAKQSLAMMCAFISKHGGPYYDIFKSVW